MIAGVTDYRASETDPGHASDPAIALQGAQPGMTKILLAHQPKSIYAAALAGYDLQISGHTHGGQYFPWNLIVALFQPYLSGLVKHDRTWLYISHGAGYWGPPNRLGVPAEINNIVLRKAKR
jgi:uncharacterized protein